MGGFEAPSILTAFDEFRAEAIRKQSISMKRAKNTKRKIHHRATPSHGGSFRHGAMPRFRDFVPHGVIPAVLLPFFDDLSIDEASYRRHLAELAGVAGVTALTVNA